MQGLEIKADVAMVSTSEEKEVSSMSSMVVKSSAEVIFMGSRFEETLECTYAPKEILMKIIKQLQAEVDDNPRSCEEDTCLSYDGDVSNSSEDDSSCSSYDYDVDDAFSMECTSSCAEEHDSLSSMESQIEITCVQPFEGMDVNKVGEDIHGEVEVHDTIIGMHAMDVLDSESL